MHVFISYRRDDVPDATDRLADELRERFGSDSVFIDVEDVGVGADFVRVIGEWISQSDVFLAIIGPRWLTAPTVSGGRRIDDPHDYVRAEIEAALERDVYCVPVLVHEATPPAPTELPPPVAPLMQRNAIELTRRYWKRDVGRLIASLDEIPGRPLDGEQRMARSARRPQDLSYADITGSEYNKKMASDEVDGLLTALRTGPDTRIMGIYAFSAPGRLTHFFLTFGLVALGDVRCTILRRQGPFLQIPYDSVQSVEKKHSLFGRGVVLRFRTSQGKVKTVEMMGMEEPIVDAIVATVRQMK
jgi:TIR domain